MWADVVNTMIALAVGLVCGYFFDRRATRAAREHSRELEAELSSLRTSIYSVGRGAPTSVVEPDSSPTQALPDQVLFKARAIQNADGRLSRTLLMSHFFARGCHASDVDAAIRQLCESGRVREDGKWLEVR